MADNEKPTAFDDTPPQDHSHTPDYSNSDANELILPPGRLYKSPGKLFGKKLPWYASPETQITLVAFVCFLCPGKLIRYQCLPST